MKWSLRRTLADITFVSSAVSKYGYAPEAVLGRHIREFVHPEDVASVDKSFAEGLKA